MGTKTIRVSDDVYKRLAARKREGESFTDLLDRIVDRDRDVEAGFGAWAETADAMEAVHERLDEELDDDAERFEHD
jgi:predicted CopG family antitoxin